MATLEEVLAQINGSGPDLTTPEDVLGGQAGSVGGPDLPRGIRNNNPGNIRRSAIPWEGKIAGSDAEFETFATPEHGVRALERNLSTYQSKYGLDTPREIINRWAPPTENDTSSYVNAVATALGVGPDDPINVQDPATMQRLRDAIIQHENGQNPYAGGAAAPASAPAAPRGVDLAGARQRAIDTRTKMEAAVAGPPQEDYNAIIQSAASLLKGPAPGGSVSAGDYAKSAVASLGSLGSMIAGGAEYVTGQLGQGEGEGNAILRNLTPHFTAMRGATDAFTQEWLSKRSKEAQERAARQFTTLDPDQTIWQGGVSEFVSSIALKGMESLAPTIVPLGGAALLGRLSVVAASTVLGGSEAVLSMGAAAADMADAVREAPIEELMSSPQFQQRLKEAQGNEVAAREAFINDVQGWSPVVTGAIVGLIAKVVGKGFDDIFSPDKGLSFFKRTGLGTWSEATQEAGQSAAEQIAQNVARRVYNSDTGVWDGVLEASLQGAAVGGPMGGGMAAAFGTRPKPITPNADTTNGVPNDVAAAINPVPVGPPTVPDTTAIPMRPFAAEPQQMDLPFGEPQPLPTQEETDGQMGLFNPPPPAAPAPPFQLPEVQKALPFINEVGAQRPGPGFTMEGPGGGQLPLGLRDRSTGIEPGAVIEPTPAPEPVGPEYQPPQGPIEYQQQADIDQPLEDEGARRERVGYRARRLDAKGNLITSKLVDTEQAANAIATGWENEAKAAGTGDIIQVLPARRTILGDKSPSAEPTGDIMAQLNDMEQSEDRRGVYLSRANLAHLKQVGKLDEVLKRGVPIRNFDNLGGILLAKDGAAASELAELKDTDAGTLDEILGYATAAGRGKQPGKAQLVAQLTDDNMNVVRERLITPEEKQQVISEWGEEVRFVPLKDALARRRELTSKERRTDTTPQDVAQSKGKVTELFAGPMLESKRDRAGRLIESDPDITEEEVGEKLIQSAAVTAAEERGKRKFADVPNPDELLFRGKEVTQAARKALKGRVQKAGLTAAKGEVEGAPLGTGETAADRKETLDRVSNAIYEANRDVQQAEGYVTGTTKGYTTKEGKYVPSVTEERDQQYRDMYGKLVDAAIRVEMQQDLGSDQDMTEAKAAYDQALQDIKLFLQTEGGYTRGEAMMDAAMRFSPKARKKVFARTEAAKKQSGDLTAVEKAVEQGFKARPEEVTTDEMSPKELTRAGKLRNTGEQIVGAEQSARNVAEAAKVSVTTAAQSGKIRLQTKRMQDAAKKLEGMLSDPDTRYLVRRWLSEYMQALRQNTPAEQQNTKRNRNWAWHGRAGRTSEMVGNLFAENVTPTTRAMGLEHVATRVVKLATRANRLGIGAEVDPAWFLAAIESGKVETLQMFLTEQVTPLQQTKDFPSDLTKEALESMDPGPLNTLYVRALNFLDAERTPDMVRAFMSREVKKWLGKKFSQKEYNVSGPYKEYDSKGNVTREITPEPRFVKARSLYSELISGGKGMSGTSGGKAMPIEQLRELYALAVEMSQSGPAKDRLPARPMGMYLNKLARRVAKSDKIEDILRASTKAGKQRVGTGGTQLTRTTTDKTAPDKYTKAESKYSPGVLLNNDPPRELKGEAKKEFEAKQDKAITEMAREYTAFGEFLTKLENDKDFAARKGDTPLASDAQTYASWLHMYLGSFVKLNEAQRLQNPKVLDEVLTLVEDLRNIRKLPTKNFIAQMGGAFGVEMAAQGRRAKGAINNALEKRNPQDKAEWMEASLSRVAAAEAAHARLNELWKNNEDYVEIIQPIMEKIRDGLIRDKWYSYEPSAEEREAVEFLFAQWSHDEKWLERLTQKQRQAVLSQEVDSKLKRELYDPLYKRLDAAGFFDREKALEKRFIKRFGQDDEARGIAIQIAAKEETGAGDRWARFGAEQSIVDIDAAQRRQRERDARLEKMSDEDAAKLTKNEQARRTALLEGTERPTEAAVHMIKLQQVRDLMQAFRALVDAKIAFDKSWSANPRGRPKAVAEEMRKAQQALRNTTAVEINNAESRMIESLRDLGAWKDLSKKDGTGTIKLPDYKEVGDQIAKLEDDLKALEAKYGYHRKFNKATGKTEPMLIGGERTDEKGRYIGQDPEYTKKRAKITDQLGELRAVYATLPKDPKSRTEAITYRRLGERLVQGLVTKAEVAQNASVLKLRQFMTELDRQLTLDLPKTPQPRGAKYKGYLKEEPAKPLTDKEELARVKAETRQMLENQQEPLPFEVAQAVNRLSGKLNLDITSMAGDARSPSYHEETAYIAVTDTLAKYPEGATLGAVVGALQRELEANHPYQPLLAKLLAFQEIKDTNLRFVELIPGTKGSGVGRLVLDSNDRPRIILSKKWFGANGLNPVEGLHALMHEMVHAATVGNIIGPMYGNRELRNKIDTLRRIAREKFGDRFDYATSDVYEFVAEAYTNSEFQRALKDYKAAELQKSSLWNRFVNIVRTALGLDTEFTDLLDAVMTITSYTFGPTPFDKYSKRVVDLEGAGLNLGVDSFLDKHVTPVANALQDRAKLRKDLIDGSTSALNTLGELGRRFMVKALTVRQLHDFFVTEFGGKDGPFSKWFLAWEARNADASRSLEDADKLSRRWTLLRDADVEDEVRLSEVMHDATTYGIHPDADFPSEAALAAKAELAALKAGKNRTAYENAKEKYDATYGKLPNAHLEASQRERYNELRAEWNKLSPEAKALYGEVRKYYTTTIERESRLFLLNAIRSSKLWEGEFTLTENDIDFRKISREDGGVTGWLERTLGIDVKADKAAIEALREKLKADAGNLTKEELKLRKRALKLSEIELKEEIAQLRIIAKMAQVPQLKKGPYFPLRRFGDYVVRATKLYDRKVFADRAEAKAWQSEIQLKDPTIQFKFPKRTDGMVEVVAFEVEYRTGETLTEAAKAREELIAEYGKDAVSDLDTKSNQFSNEASIPSNAALQALLGKLEGNPGAQAAVRNFYLQTLSDRSFRKNEIKRKTIRGANAHQQQRAFAFYAKAASYYTAQLRYGHVMASAKLEMSEFVDTYRQKPRDRHSALMLRKVADELALRDQQAAEIHDLPNFIRRGTEFGQFMLLTSPSYWMINASQPWMVTVPWLSGYTSTLNAVNELKKAQNLILHPLLKEATSSYGGFKALWSKTTAESAFTVVDQVENQIRNSKHERKDDLLRMLDELKQASIIDLSFVAELRQIATGETNKMADAVLDASRIMAHLTEVNNRLMVSIAAYEIYRKQGFDHQTAVQFAKHAVAKTQFDYSAANKSRLFSANDAAWKPLVFQFMQYMQHMYVLMFEQVGRAIRSESTGDRKRAVRILGGMLGSHMIAGGIVGMTIQPIKWAFGLLAMAFGDDDEDNTFRNAVSGETYDRWVAEALSAIFGTNKFSEVLRAGAPRAVGMDLSTRMALGQIYMADLNPKNAETLAGSIVMSFLGPMPGLIGNMYQATQKFAEGDLDRAAELASPKMIRDVVRAYRFADEGVTDNTGKVILRPSQLSPLDLFWQSMGFSPSQIAELYARNSAVKDRQVFANNRKAEVLKMQRMVKRTGNYREAQLALREYNRQFPENKITLSEVVKSLQGQREDEQTAQQYGATLGDRERAFAREGNPYNVE